jgi:predicted aspartyl protease
MHKRIRRTLALAALASVIALAGAAGAGAQAPPSPVQVPVKVLRNPDGEAVVLVQVTVNSQPVTFVVDTGASQSVISRRVAKSLALPKAGRRTRTLSAGGVGVSQPVTISNWAVGTLTLAPRKIASVRLGLARDIGAFGLLGSDVLSGFGKVSIDYAHGILTLGG